jgi:tetratricopeptide (TPR) repeat protein
MQRALTRHGWLTACGMVLVLQGCDRGRAENARESGVVSEAEQTERTAKIPVTTKSQEARKLYNEGLARFDQLRFHDAREKFQQAVAKDPAFAMAHYQLALTAPSNKEGLAHTKQAVALSEAASEGERLAILALQAGFNAEPAKSLEYSRQMVAKYPEDERARNNLGVTLFIQQKYSDAADELEKAIEIDSAFSPAYNMLGYAHRSLGDYPEAEKAFKKYIELVPNDPNPYDSYAELLLKTGRFDESIAQYQKALSLDPHFVGSHFGIASALMFQGKHSQAIAQAEKLNRAAQNDGDRRLAMFTRTVVYADQGKTDQALKELQRQYDLGAKIGDTAAMAADAVSMGNVLLNAGKFDAAEKRFQQALTLVQKSGLSSEVKEDAELAGSYHKARVALKRKDLAAAKSGAAEYLKGAEARQNDFRIRQAHELAGKIALKEKNFDQALAELKQANQQDPGVLYAIGLAHQGNGDQDQARELFKQAAESYTLPTLNYAFIRAKAKQQAMTQPTS